MLHRVTPAMLEEGLERQEFFLLFQPRFDTFLHRVVSAEALVRWQRPGAGIIPPIDFIEIAERHNIIERLGLWVLTEACKAAARWHREGRDIGISINVSPLQVHPRLSDQLGRLIAELGFPPDNIELEVTEGVLLSPEKSEILKELTALGVGIAIDDFGTGHSSLSYLRHFEAQSLKIDGIFLQDLPGDLNGCLLLDSMVNLGHGLGMKVVCEGVENQEQMELVELSQADEVQGYAISRPIPEVEFLNRFGALYPLVDKCAISHAGCANTGSSR